MNGTATKRYQDRTAATTLIMILGFIYASTHVFSYGA